MGRGWTIIGRLDRAEFASLHVKMKHGMLTSTFLFHFLLNS